MTRAAPCWLLSAALWAAGPAPLLRADDTQTATSATAATPTALSNDALLAELAAIDARRALLVSDPAYRRARRRVWLGVCLGGPAAVVALAAAYVHPFTYATDDESNLRGRRVTGGLALGMGAAAIVGFGFAMAGVHRNPHSGELASLRRSERTLAQELHRRARLSLTATGLTVTF
jgi:hypothetical protein